MIKKLVIFISFSIGISLFSQTVDLDAIAEPYPSPFISDWQSTPGLFNLTVTNNSGNSLSINIRAEIIKEGELLGHGVKRDIDLSAYGLRNIDNIDFLDLNSWSYANDISDQIMRSGRLPEGQYELCFTYFENRSPAARSCAEFAIVIPEIPDLLEPIDDMNVTESFPRFEWTPAFVPGNMEMKYRLIVCHNEINEDPNYSITKVPILNTITTENFLVYPVSSPPLEEGNIYVWQVQLLDKNSNPLGENNGKTEIGRFIYGSGQQTGSVTYVNDGIGEDIDWYNSPLIRGNWDGESEDFYYAVGTQPGNSDLLSWTYCGDAKSFDATLNLQEGTTYYISVKADEFGEPVSSDGCTIDITAPVSSVDSLADSLQTPFDVKWTGSDSLSGIKQYVIQSKVADSSFSDWITVEDSTTSKSFAGETGQTYYFRSRAIDRAGNVENYPDSADAKTFVKKPGDSIYVLVPNVSYLKITDSTKVEEKDGKTTLKGKAKLVIEPTPFDNFEKEIDLSDSTICDSTAITFKKNIATNVLEPIEGNIVLSDTTGVKEVYKEVLKIVELSFKSKRPTDSRMRVDSAFLQLPFNIPKMNNSNLMPLDSIPITAAGLAFSKDIDKKWSKWGMTFTIKELTLAAEEAPPFIKAKTNVKFNNTSDTTTNFATNATIGFRGKDDIYAHVVPDSTPMRLIPNEDYVLLDSIWFEKPDDEWKLGAALQFKYPAPLDSITDQSKANILVGDNGFDLDLALINESRDSTFDKNDQTALRICDYVAIDLTNVNLKLQSVENNGEMELSKEDSYVEFMADIYVGENSPKRIAIGDPDEDKNGFKITFAGDPQVPGVSVKDNPFDIGPVQLSGFTEGDGLGVSFDPFEISLSGGLGINKKGTFSGKVNFENLVINKDGLDFSDFSVRGGAITVMDVVTATIDSIGYSAEPTELSFTKQESDTSAKTETIEVDSYFRLAGASLELDLEGDGGGGGCKEFLLYEIDNSTNVVVRDAWFYVQNTCSLTADLEYREEPEPLLNFSGSVTIPSAGIKGMALGHIGERDQQPTFGIFMAASGINANLGYITLNEIGGGFFYRPLQDNIDQVKDLVGLQKGSLMENDISNIIESDMPAPDELTFAVMLYAGIYVQSKEVCEANGLITLTDNYFELLAKAKMMRAEADGNIQLLISWDPKYATGHVGFEMKKKDAVEINQNLEFFVYSEEASGIEGGIWAVMGNGNVKIFPTVLSTQLSTEFFLGPPGFYFDVNYEEPYKFWIIEGSYGYETMFWWEKSVSWGAYANVHGSLDLYVVGASCGLEGALIGTSQDLLIYSVGSFSASVMGETVYDGSIWVSLGTNGLDGGKGRNSTYDGYIESARNMADDMQDEIQDMSEDIESARDNAIQLSDEQRIAAGEALYNIVGDTNLVNIMEVKNLYQQDKNNYLNHGGNLDYVFEQYIFFGEVENLNDKKDDIDNDSLEINNNLATLNNNSDNLIDRIQSYKSRVSTTLPQISETLELSNPVDTGTVQSISIDTIDVQIPIGGTIDEEIVNQNQENTKTMKSDIQAYKDSLLAQSEKIIDDLVYADSILYSGNVSVNSLSVDYYRHSNKIAQNTASYIRYYEKLKRTYSGKSINLRLNSKTGIEQGVASQANNISDENQLVALIELRINLINFLLGEAGAGTTTQQDLSNMSTEEKRDYCIALGKEVWYHIPYNGMHSIVMNTNSELNNFINDFNLSRNQYFQEWGAIGNSVQAIHNVKSETYNYLYDLYDAMSWEYENGGPTQNLDNNAAQISPKGYQFGGQVYNNLHGLGNQGGNYFQNFAGNMPVNPGNQNPENQNAGGLLQQNQPNISQSLLRGLEIGTAAKKIRDFETYSSKREYIGEISFPPQVNEFSGSFVSEEESYGYYGILSLNYEAEHSTGGCFYNIDISDVTNGPVSLGNGRNPSFYLFKTLDPSTNYNICMTAFANSGFNLSNSVNFPIQYFTYGYDEYEGGDYQAEFDNEDQTRPLSPTFQTAYYSAKQDEIIFNYISDDPESGIAEYQYAIADSFWYDYTNLGAPPQRRFNLVRNWESTGGRTENNIRGLASEHNDKYYIMGKAKNGAGIWSIVSVSNEIKADTSAPLDFYIIDFEVNQLQSQSLTHQTQPTYQYSASWTEATDPESEVIYLVGLGTDEGSDDLLEFGPLYDNQTDLNAEVFQIGQNREIFYITIKAINTSGLGIMKSTSCNINDNQSEAANGRIKKQDKNNKRKKGKRL